MASIIDFWRAYKPHDPPYIHPLDAKELGEGERFFDFTQYDFGGFVASKRFGAYRDNRFHLSLLPIPYSGRIETADIIILQLNPGFNCTDYYAEYRDARFRALKVRNLHQDLSNTPYPFIFLDPEFCWHSGFGHWERKFRKILTELASRRFGGSYVRALRELSQRLACLELIPYHSPKFNGACMKYVQSLPSVRAAKDFVREKIEHSALAGERIVIALRKEVEWGIKPSEPNVIALDRYQKQGAHLTINADGSGIGGVILQRLSAERR